MCFPRVPNESEQPLERKEGPILKITQLSVFPYELEWRMLLTTAAVPLPVITMGDLKTH